MRFNKRYPILTAVLIFIGITLVYFLLGYYGLKLATINDNASPIWPASGFAAGALILAGRKFAPAIFIGSALVNMTVATPLFSVVGVATGNMLEAYIAAYFISWIFKNGNVRTYSELISISLGAVVASSISATISIWSLVYGNVISPDSVSYAWLTWWSGNAIGILIVLPVFTELLNRAPKKKVFELKRVLFTVGMAAVMLLGLTLVFVKELNQAFAWSLSPLLIIAGLKGGRLHSRILNILIALLVILLTAEGYGPFEHGDVNLNLIYVQTLLVSYAMAILFVKPLETEYSPGRKYLLGVGFSWITLFIVIYMSTHYEQVHTLDDFSKNTQIAVQSVERTEIRYESLINGYSALFRIKKSEMTREDWKVFSENLNLTKNYDAIFGIGFARYVTVHDLQNFLGHNKINLHMVNEELANRFDHHYVLQFMEPENKNLKAIGLDIGSEEKRRLTIEKALKLEKVYATGSVFLIQDELKRKGFVLLRSAFDLNGKLQGMIVAPVVNEVFFGKTFAQYSHLLKIKISHNDIPIHATNSGLTEEFKRDIYFESRTLELFGEKFKFEFYPSEEFFARHSGSAAFLALILSIFMLFIAAFLLEQLTFNQKAGVLIEQRTKELEESKVQLIHSSKMASLGEMASGMAHEINNPLAIIQGKVKVISMMLEELEIKQPTLFQEIHKIKLTTDRIEKIVKGLRNFSRASNNDPFELAPLGRLITETMDLCSEKFKSEGIKILIDDVPQVSLLCRPSQILQVFINLLNNSYDAVENLEHKWIEVSFKLRPKNQISIIFTDSGKGIPPEIAEKIMDPFFTTKEVRKGTGLGLSIAKSLIDGHGGLLWLDTSHRNTRFVIDLECRPHFPESPQGA